MPGRDEHHESVTWADQELVLTSLEREQLTAATRRRFPRRQLKGFEILILWTLRMYVLFMIGVVIYQAWTGAH